MRPNRIILVRHAESEGNLDRINYLTTPDYALNLTNTGKEQSIQVGEEIKHVVSSESIYAYVSPYYRTRQTYEGLHAVINENIVASIEDPRLREQDWGHLRHPDTNSLIMSERQEFGTFYYRIQDGESGADVYDRISTFLETLHRDFKKPDYPQNCLIVTHGLTLRLFLMRWFHLSVEEFEQLSNPDNGQVVILIKDTNDKYRLSQPLLLRNGGILG